MWSLCGPRDTSHLELIFFFWPHPVACGVLVPRPGMEPGPPSVEAQSPNHWTAREVLTMK